MINAIGLQNPGSDAVINDIMPKLDKTETRFIINISGSSVQEYGEISIASFALIIPP
jgi:dihydroorotate dehydrogenase (NAD+) catalytic subunit